MSEKRRGRRPGSNPKNIILKVRLDEEDSKKLAWVCYDLGMSKSEAIRKLINLYYEKLRNKY